MNVNCKVALTDEQRNKIKRHLTGKDVKALATRKEVCQLVNELLAAVIATTEVVPPEPDQAVMNFPEGGHDDCCRANKLLLARINVLQHRLDTGR